MKKINTLGTRIKHTKSTMIAIARFKNTFKYFLTDGRILLPLFCLYRLFCLNQRLFLHNPLFLLQEGV